jgi:hypothetical protein
MAVLRLQGLQGQHPVGLVAQRARLPGQTEKGGWMLSDGVEMTQWLPALPFTGPVPVVSGCLCQTPPPCSGTVTLELDLFVPHDLKPSLCFNDERKVPHVRSKNISAPQYGGAPLRQGAHAHQHPAPPLQGDLRGIGCTSVARSIPPARIAGCGCGLARSKTLSAERSARCAILRNRNGARPS